MNEIELPDFVLRHTDTSTDALKEQSMGTQAQVVLHKDDNIYIWLDNAEYPQIGLVTPKMIADMNIVKRLFIQMFKIANKWFMVPAYLFIALMPWGKKLKIIDNFVEFFTETSFKAMKSHILDEKYQTRFSKEIEWMIFNLLKKLNIPMLRAIKCSEIISTIVQADTAYRYRVMDMFEGIRKEKLIENPRKEISRATDMLLSREKDAYTRSKFLWVSYIIQIVLLHPKFKKIFIDVIKQTKITNLKFNEIDLYWALLYKDYNALGMSYERRKEYLGDASIPPLEKLQ